MKHPFKKRLSAQRELPLFTFALSMKKDELRKQFRQKRRELNEEQIKASSKAIAERFMDLLEQLQRPAHFIHLFLPIEENREVNTWSLVKALRGREDTHIVVSRTDFDEGRMDHFLLEEDTSLAKNELGIPEPQEGRAVPTEKIDLVVMPLLAYDKQGDRVGYGAGFYDRFLENCREDVIKVGLSFFEPVPKIQDVGEHDIVLDHCVTPERVYSF